MTFEIQITDLDNHSANVVLEEHWWRSDTWSAVSPHTIGTAGAGTWDRLGFARIVNLWEDNSKVLQMRGVARFPFRVGDTGEGFHLVAGRRINDGVIAWECVRAV